MVRGGLLLLLLLATNSIAAIQLTDDAGHRLSVTQPVKRIITLSPHTTELVYAAGAGKYLVAATAFSNYPHQALSLPRIGNATRLDVERILALKPDLVIGWLSGNSASQIQQLRRAGINVYMTEPDELDDIPRYLNALGRVSDTLATATQALQEYQQTLTELRRRYQYREPIDVFLQVSEVPLYTLNSQHIVSRALAMCGGRNIFADVTLLAPTVSVEAVVQRNPQVIIASVYPGANIDLSNWQRFPGLRAVRQKNLFQMNADNLMRSTPRILSGVTEICRLLDVARQRGGQQSQ